MKVSDDKYYLKDSVIVNVKEEEAKFLEVFFKEEQNENLYGEIYGFVKDEEGRPIEGANVHVMNEDYISLMETFTDSGGQYFFTEVKQQVNYRIYAIADNKKLENPVMLTVEKLERYEINFVLESKLNRNFLSLKGKVKEKGTNKPINKAAIYAYIIDKDNNENLISIEKTNEEGEFYFWQINPGNYSIKITASGYKSAKIVKFVNGKNSEFEISMEIDKSNYILKGTIYGVIKDSYENPISNADVILYEVKGESLIPIRFTKSDDDGVYLFDDLEDGNYKIKGNKLIEENI